MFCWNPQDFHFCINYRFSNGLRPSWPQSLCSVEFLLSGKLIEQLWKIERLFPPSFELGTFRVLGERDNHYTTETCSQGWVCLFHRTLLRTRIKLQIALHSLICKYLLFLAANKKKFQCSAGILKTFIFASTTGLATVFVPLGRKAFVIGKLIEQLWKIERLFPPSFELGTFRVLGERDNHYTTETCSQGWVCLFHRTLLGTRIKLQIALHSLICKYLLFLAANKKKFQCSAGILKTFIFASTTGLATVFVPLGRKAFIVLSSSSTES